MRIGYLAYNILGSLAAPGLLAAAAVSGRLRGGWRDRFGLVRPLPEGGRPRIWVHAVSVGEVRVGASLILAILARSPEAMCWLSATTETGRAEARRCLPPGLPVMAFPLDVFGGPKRALKRLRPDLAVMIETEIWPNFIKTAREMGVPVMLANGRLSARSVNRYRKIRFLFEDVIRRVNLIAAIGPADRDRFVSLGADPERTLAVGNAKFDDLSDRRNPERVAALRRLAGWPEGTPVFAAGSTRSGEEAVILDVYMRLKADFPDLRLVIAPRHIQRSEAIEKLIRSKGVEAASRSRMDQAGPTRKDVVLLDTIGELFDWYGLATIAFCGGSLVPLGGQNPLEPAVWGAPVLYGPSMEDFEGARDLLERVGAGRTAADGDALYRAARELLSHPEEAGRRGQAGREAVEGMPRVSDRLAEMALELAEMSGEDFFDAQVAKNRESEPRESLEEVKKAVFKDNLLS